MFPFHFLPADNEMITCWSFNHHSILHLSHQVEHTMFRHPYTHNPSLSCLILFVTPAVTLLRRSCGTMPGKKAEPGETGHAYGERPGASMNVQRSSTSTLERPGARSGSQTRLHGRWLVGARGLWMTVAFIQVG